MFKLCPKACAWLQNELYGRMGTSIARQVLDCQTMDQRPVVDSDGTTGESN